MRTGRKSYEELLENTEVALVPIRKIAERSGLCERTVSKHLQNGLSKLGRSCTC
jgi:predicted transcriptional regulator